MLIGLLVFAIMTVQAVNFRRAIIYSAVFSLIMSLIFLQYKAPDVAIAEAIIGSALATVLYLVALRKQERITVCLLGGDCFSPEDDTGNNGLVGEASLLVQALSAHFGREKIALKLIRSDEPLELLLEQQYFDLLLCQADHQLTLYGKQTDYRLDAIDRLAQENKLGVDRVRIVRCERGGSCDA